MLVADVKLRAFSAASVTSIYVFLELYPYHQFSVSSNTTDVSFVQPENEELSISVTRLPIVTVVKDGQRSNI